jgi:Nucleotidyltransferase/DNA polymerase involved in DNA repair
MTRSSGSNSTAAKDRQAEVQQILTILHKWGIHTIGQFAALDKEELAARLGPEAVRMWERAGNGQSSRPLKFVQPPESFEESFEFENELETAEPLLFMLRRFLEQLSVRLSAVYQVIKELTLRITFTNKQIYERCFKIPQLTNDVDLLFRMLHTHLENFKSEYPITAVSLQAEPANPSRQQFGLFETSLRDPNQLYETLGRLVALLGSDRVGTPVLEETHRPNAFHLEPFSWEQPGGTTSVSSHYSSDATERVPPISTNAMSKPALRRFRPNIAASVLLAEGQPIHLRSGQVSGAVSGQLGPYRTSGNWWDEKIWLRSEWDLELEGGEILRAHEVKGKWNVDGIYD